MSAERPCRLSLAVAVALFANGFAVAGDDELPGVEFLDYLGSWEESDEDWQLMKDSNALRGRPVKSEQSDAGSDDEASTEKENER